MPEPPTTVTRGPFPRGVNYSRPADEIRDDELYEMQNCRLGNIGQVVKRSGSTPLNATALNSGATVTACGKQRFSSSSQKTFAIIGNKFYENVEAGTPDDRTNSKTITAADDNTWETVNAGGTLVGHNGVSGDTIIKWAASGNLATLDVDSRFTTSEHVEWFDRRAWWGNLSSGANRVWYSDADDIETYGATSFQTFDYDVTGIKAMVGGIYVHTARTITIVTPTRDSSAPYRKTDIIIAENNMGGSESGRAIVNVPGIGQCFPRRDGIYALTPGQELIKISEKLDGSRFWNTINGDRLAYSFAEIYPLRGWVIFWLPYGASQTNMNRPMIFDYRLSKIMGEWVWHGPDANLTRNCGAVIDGLPYFGGFDGFVYKHETGAFDNDGTSNNAYDAYFSTGMLPPSGYNDDCRWTKARVFYEVAGIHTVDVQETSPDIAARTQTMQLGGVYAGIGVDFAIGISPIAGNSEVAYADMDLQGSSPFKQIKIRNANVSQAFTIRRIVKAFENVGAVRRQLSGR